MIKQRHVAAVLAEFIGTLTLVLIVLSVSLYRFPFFTAIAAGVTVAVFVSAFSKIGAGHLNPAVSLGLWTIRQSSLLKTISFIIAQLLAGLAGWQIYEKLTEQALKNNTTAGLEWNWTVFGAEFIGAFIFGIAVSAVVTQKIQGYQQAYTIGAGLFLGLTVAGLASAAILNPAVALGTRSLDINYAVASILGFTIASVLVAYVMVPVLSVKKVRKSASPIDAPVVVAGPEEIAEEETPVVASVASAKPATKKASAKKNTAKKSTAKKSNRKKTTSKK
jgi:glycerol uptake facilitator protein